MTIQARRRLRPYRARRLGAGTCRRLRGRSAFVLILAMLVVPLPPFALDLCFTFNICFGLMILLAALYTAKADRFLVVPDPVADDDLAAPVAKRRGGAGHPARRLSRFRRPRAA